MKTKIEQAKQILEALGLPKQQQNERSALILLALCKIRPNDEWKNAIRVSMSVVGNRKNAKYEGVMRFVAGNYKKNMQKTQEKLSDDKLYISSFKQM